MTPEQALSVVYRHMGPMTDHVMERYRAELAEAMSRELAR